MPYTRLTQLGIGGRAYDSPTYVDLSSANWGWTAYPVGVEYEADAVTRLGQMPVGVADYPVEQPGDFIALTSANWGWTSFPVTVPGEAFYLTRADWGWAPQKPVICGQDPSGYAYSFNSDVWPSCVFNEHVFGPRAATEIDLVAQDWGWQPLDITVEFSDPVDVGLQLANWGWRDLPLAVSFGTDVHLQVSVWGWQPHPITVSIPYDIDLQAANWGWTNLPLGISYSYNVGLVTAAWGWQSFPIDVDSASFDIDLRRDQWGWQSSPITVRQTSLLQGDIEAIAEAIYQKFVSEGVITQVLETWMRMGCDDGYPQTFHTRENGHNIECGNITIEQTTDNKGNVTQTRKP